MENLVFFFVKCLFLGFLLVVGFGGEDCRILKGGLGFLCWFIIRGEIFNVMVVVITRKVI